MGILQRYPVAHAYSPALPVLPAAPVSPFEGFVLFLPWLNTHSSSNKTALSHLTEDNIKRAAIRFLKTYYKFRPRTSKTESILDMQTADGIIADGMLRFDDENEKTFLATVEATSSDKRGEVVYTLLKNTLFWDSFAFSSITSAFVFSYCYAYSYLSVKQIGLMGSIAILSLILIITFTLYFLIFQHRHKYRYIYAVEQFKRYHANEQWIAMADDVFKKGIDEDSDRIVKSPDDKYLQELKDQCILNGFGLIEVDKNLDARPLITPARDEMFGSKRGVLKFFSTNSPKQAKVKGQLKNVWKKTGVNEALQSKTAQSLMRYQKTYFHQTIMVCMAAAIVGIIYYKELQNADVVYLNEKKYAKELTKKQAGFTREADIVVIDTPQVAVMNRKDLEIVLEDEPEDTPENITREDIEDAVDVSKAEAEVLGMDVKYKERPQIVIHNHTDPDAAYDCERFYNIRQKVYVVQESQYVEAVSAQLRVDQLHKKGITANILWLGCFSKDKDYIVYFDLMYTDKDEAATTAKEYTSKLKKQGALKRNLQIRTISRVH